MHASSSAYLKGFLAWNDKCFWVSTSGNSCCMGTREGNFPARQAEAVCFLDRATILQNWTKNCRASPMTVRIILSLQGCLWLALKQQHSCRVSGSTHAPPQSWPVAEIPEGNGCERGFKSVKLLFFPFFPPCLVVWGFLKGLLCFVCADASYTKKKKSWYVSVTKRHYWFQSSSAP